MESARPKTTGSPTHTSSPQPAWGQEGREKGVIDQQRRLVTPSGGPGGICEQRSVGLSGHAGGSTRVLAPRAAERGLLQQPGCGNLRPLRLQLLVGEGLRIPAGGCGRARRRVSRGRASTPQHRACPHRPQGAPRWPIAPRNANALVASPVPPPAAAGHICDPLMGPRSADADAVAPLVAGFNAPWGKCLIPPA